MHFINIHNKSSHDQNFEVHGWNNNQNTTIKAGQTSTISAPDGSSGAIIALHDGHEGEQVEITRNAYGGNDFFDVSNIVGAGGNITAMQVGDQSTLKGDPDFMQDMDSAWHKASQSVRAQLKDFVSTDSQGNVKRIGPIKDSPELEKLVRTFANGKAYIGVGAWNGNPDNPNDNAQSTAGHGNKDILITYSDGDTSPDLAQPKQESHAAEVHGVHPAAFTETAAPATDPLKNVKLAAGSRSHVPLPTTFKGRVQRGTQLPATWVEFQISASNDGAAHGDISLEQGCDGAATIASTDGSNRLNGFTDDVLKHAPAATCTKKSDGTKAIATTVGN
ncbi:Hypothetical protein PENO1_067380 [Penicillium occitanis (nom. inval.)]|nr:hypothetical protein PENOC_090600 [Penicillium occitanis (nom. inval.)]PCG96639.1 Hypothetical protein PENO1_067380 [Penicillium occitanis (nom. inval.)]